MIITVAIVALVLAAVGYVLASRLKGQPVNGRRLLVLPGVLTAIGALELVRSVSGGLSPWDAGLLAAGLLAAVGLGLARGATVAVFVRDSHGWLRYRPATLALWAVTVGVRVGLTVFAHLAGAAVAAGGPALLLTVGTTLLAEGAVVAQRASAAGGQQWQAGVSARHTTFR